MSKPSIKNLLKSKFLHLFVIFVAFGIFLFLNREILYYRFDGAVVDRYLRSQDIEDRGNLIDERIFISDSDIYIASGYLYAGGEEPTRYNFQHPPLIKYLFGFSSVYFGNPYWVQVVFSLVLLVIVYFFGLKISKNPYIGLTASLMLLLDPVYKEVSTYALLDLGQAVFILIYLFVALFYPKKAILEGVLLGLATSSKYFSPVLFFVFILYFYKTFLIKEKISIKNEVVKVAVALLVFGLTYTVSFIKSGGDFNIFFWQAKITKFMFDHNLSGEIGGIFVLLLQGPVLRLLFLIVNTIFLIFNKDVNIRRLILAVPVLYLLFIINQIPFSRYLILILPFIYLGIASILIEKDACKRFLKRL